MSLINKMLQDLDARGTPAAESFPSQIRPVARARAALAERVDVRTIVLAIAGVAGACAVGAALWFGWTHYRQAPAAAARPAALAAAPSRAATQAPAAAQPVQGMRSTITMGPAPAEALAPAPAPAVKETPAKLHKVRADEMARLDKQARAAAPAPAPAPAAAAKSVAGFEPDSEEARAARQAIMAELQARISAGSKPAAIAHASTRAEKRKALAEARDAKASRPARAGAQGVQEAAPQRAEGEYRHALTALQDGRMTEALAALEQTLKLDPGHDAARQTLVGLLIEAKRADDAIRHLQAGLALDPRQPALAMLLARLQIERGGSGIDTLTRTLPYVGNNADYHAFLAGALQREQRHREAAEQYQAALRAAPANGVWWMGLGMSLQAEKRNAEALEAFQRARASGTLSVELQAFVERRLQMLAR
jgi:MSHA biogenesis protein MshN